MEKDSESITAHSGLQAALPLAETRDQRQSGQVLTLVPKLERIRAFVAANGQNMTRDEVILEELSKLLHAKVHDETVAEESTRQFYLADGEPAAAVRERVDRLLQDASRSRDGGTPCQPIALDDQSLLFAVELLQDSQLRLAERDVVGEAYESLIFPSLRGGQGQFFTPRNVARSMAEMLDVPNGGRVIDPACGTGGFLREVARVAEAQRREVDLVGVDKDSLLARLAADSLGLQVGEVTVACANSLTPRSNLSGAIETLLAPDSYDAVVTNPPFGAKIPVTGVEVLAHFDLAYHWVLSRSKETWSKTSRVKDAAPPQTLFIEACWRLLKEGGRCAIVLPEGVLGNQSTGFIRQWLVERADILGVIDCPLETFMPSTSTKTAIIVFEKRRQPRRPKVFMAIAESCGHDRRGNPVHGPDGEIDDDFPGVIDAWRAHCAGTPRSAE